MLMRFVAMALGGTRMSDLISRQAAIELMHTLYPSAPFMRMNRKRWEEKYKPYIECEKALERLPSAQPYTDEEIQKMQEIEQAQIQKTFALGREEALSEIIRCKDCEYGKQDEAGRWFCVGLGCQIGNEDGSGYCADAERRIDG